VTKDPKQLEKDIEILTARVEKEQQGSSLPFLSLFITHTHTHTKHTHTH
jgi:hypothetical protein